MIEKLQAETATARRQINADALGRECDWFNQVLEARFQHYFGQPGTDFFYPEAPDLSGDASDYAQTVRELDLDEDERLVLMLAMMPQLRPHGLDLFFTQNKLYGQRFTEFGGSRGKTHEGFLPTCETAVFILAGDDLARRFAVNALFDDGHRLVRQRLLRFEQADSGEPRLSARLTLTYDYFQAFTSGIRHKPDFSGHFPAKLITTRLQWSDLVLAPEIRHEVENLNVWLAQSNHLMADWGLDRAVKAGYRCLFYGPPGTGKTLTATLIGAQAGVDVYRIDLSMVVSKYIGETEKNLANVFDQAEDKRWILFFDEADALFGKRTQGNTSNDRHANQEISYLLQRVEDFPGVVILASNLKGNIDEAFARRFQSAVYFAMPEFEQRLGLWRGIFQDSERLGADVDLPLLAEKYPLSGGAITNVVRYAAIRATRLGRTRLVQDDLVDGITREMMKEGRTF